MARALISLLLVPLLLSPCLAQSALDDIRAKGVLVIATDPTYAPFEFVKDERIQGFDVDLGAEIGRELGVRVEWLSMEWAGIVGALETRKCDAVMAGVTITDERKKNLGFSRPYFLSGQCIVRRRSNERIREPKDLLDKTVAVIQETTGQYAVEKLGVPKSRIHRFDTQADGLLDVQNGKSDAAVGDLPAVKAMLRESFPDLEVIGGIFTQENVGIETRKADRELIGAINAALERILVDGRYARIYQKWIEEPLKLDDLAQLARLKDFGTPVPASMVTLSRDPAPATSGSARRTPSGAFTIRWDLLRNAFPQLLRGARLTLLVTLLTLAIGVPLGLLVALLRLSVIPPLKWLATAYVEVIRGTPLLMQIYVIYFVLPALGLNLNPLTSAVVALSMNAAAYISEIFRAGIESIEVGQMEAARSLGMDYMGAMRWVILPQTVRRVLPPLTNEAVALLKDTSLVSVVALTELMRVGKELATNQGSPTTIYLGVALIYLSMTLPLTWLVRRLEAVWRPVSKDRIKSPRAKPNLQAAK